VLTTSAKVVIALSALEISQALAVCVANSRIEKAIEW
jgi:hypothetical protein